MTGNGETEVKETNEDRVAGKLARRVERQIRWRMRVWAQCELAIRAANAELQQLGYAKVPVPQVDLGELEEAQLQQYALGIIDEEE